MNTQILIKALGIWYTFLTLPALAIAGVAYLRKYPSNGGKLLGYGAIAAAVGSLFNNLFPWQSLLSETQNKLPDWAHLTMSLANVVHLLGLNTMVIGLLIITFRKPNKTV